MQRGWIWRTGGGRPPGRLTLTQGLAMLPLGFGWVLATFAAIFWYIAYLTLVAPPPGIRRHFDLGVVAYLVLTHAMLAIFLLAKWRERKAKAGAREVRDFGD